MLFGRTCREIGRKKPVFVVVCSLVWLLVQATPGSGRGPSVSAAADAAEQGASANSGLDELVFKQTEFLDVREGYVTLNWQAYEAASEYRVADQTGDVMYRGEFNQAFISGLADGTHTFVVEAVDGQGQVVARSRQLANVQVSHWPMWQAIASFVAGLIVFLILIAVIIRGSLVADMGGDMEPIEATGSQA